MAMEFREWYNENILTYFSSESQCGMQLNDAYAFGGLCLFVKSLHHIAIERRLHKFIAECNLINKRCSFGTRQQTDRITDRRRTCPIT